ncbi:hypothetical protein ACGFYQ_16635 [Streptomyces sp. NPDC048258]|uniref:hypothetical protein n=1 Tax=Streptomyces sp. NPDC048258 TaxID=3365527 RepID=UPI003712F50F
MRTSCTTTSSNFHDVMVGVAKLLGGADAGIREMTDAKHETAEYQRDLYGA